MASVASFTTTGYDMGPVPIAYEHVLRLLHEMDADLDEFITEADVSRFVTEHGLPFTDAEVRSMFAEANSSANGLMDVEQLGKAVSYKFPHRRHNDDWVRLFSLAPRPRMGGTRLTALVAPPLEQEPVRANFEQEPAILTFSPLTKASATRTGGLGLHTCSSLGSAASTARSRGTSRQATAPFNTAPRPLYDGARLGSETLSIIDVDAHITEPHDLWTSRAPAGLRDRVPRVVRSGDQRAWIVDRDTQISHSTPTSVV